MTAARTSTPAITTALLSALVLSACGLLFVFESSVAESFTTFHDPYYLLKQQLFGFAISIGAFVVGLLIPTAWWLMAAPVLFVGTLLSLVAVFLPGIGLRLNGANRWLNLGFFSVQPVEFFKLGMVAYFATWLSKHQRFGPFVFLLAIPAILLILQPDLGSLLLVLAIGLGLYFTAGGDLKKLALIGAAGIPLLVIAIALSPYRLQRIKTFINPELDPLGSSFHIRQITLALGRGGWFGQGIGNSQQRYSYIPEASTDSIFAIVGEEIGFVGSLMVLATFGAFFYSLYAIASKVRQRPIQLLAFGILIWLVAQTLLNLSAVVALVPLTGVPLPFFSYGRSSLIMVLLATGIMIRIARENAHT